MEALPPFLSRAFATQSFDESPLPDTGMECTLFDVFQQAVVGRNFRHFGIVDN